MYGAYDRHVQQRKAKKRDCGGERDEDAAMDVLSHEER